MQSPAADMPGLDQLSLATAEAALRALGSGPDGLNAAEAAQRLAATGPNQVAQDAEPSLSAELWGRARNPLNGLLLALAAVSMLLGDLRAAAVIATMVVLAVLTAFIQEHRSNHAAARLRAMVTTTASVRRRGADGVAALAEVPIAALVPGDVVQLSAGDMIPGDLRLLEAKDLFVNQSALTGESMAAEKFAEPAAQPVQSPFGPASGHRSGGTAAGAWGGRVARRRRPSWTAPRGARPGVHTGLVGHPRYRAACAPRRRRRADRTLAALRRLAQRHGRDPRRCCRPSSASAATEQSGALQLGQPQQAGHRAGHVKPARP